MARYDKGDVELARQDYNQAQQLNPQLAEGFYDREFHRPQIGGDANDR
jgi:hypothetical protein